MNLRRFEIFRAVIESATVTQASQRLGLTQPAVTKALQQLEDELGLTLFDRTRGRLHPTSDANDLYTYLDEIFLRLSMLSGFATDRRELRRGHVNFACNAFFSSLFIPKILSAFRIEHPGITIAMQTRSSSKINELVDSGLLSIGVGAPMEPSSNVKLDLLMRLRGVCVLPPGHHLSEQEIITNFDLVHEPLIVTSDLDRTRGMVETFFEPGTNLRNVICETSLASDACQLVAEGLGVSIVNELTALTTKGVVVRSLNDAMLYDTSILTGYRNPLTLAEKAFVKMVKTMTPQIAASIKGMASK